MIAKHAALRAAPDEADLDHVQSARPRRQPWVERERAPGGPQDAQDRYLRLLARLSGRLKQEEVRRRLMAAPSPAAVVSVLTAD